MSLLRHRVALWIDISGRFITAALGSRTLVYRERSERHRRSALCEQGTSASHAADTCSEDMRRRLLPVNPRSSARKWGFPFVLCLRAVSAFTQAPPCARSALGLALAQRSSRPPLAGLNKRLGLAQRSSRPPPAGLLPNQTWVDSAHSRATWAPHRGAAPGLVATSAASARASEDTGDMSGAVEVEKKFRLEGDAEQRVALSLPLEGVGSFLSPGGLLVLAVNAYA